MKYEEFKSTPVLYEAYKKTRRGKRSKKAEAIFESSETENLKRIARQIDKGYLPAGLDSFMIYEPKARTINAPAFRDKIVQRDLTDNVIYPALVKSIPFNAFAAQTGKGQHYGVDMMEKQMRHYFLKRKAADEQRRRELGLPYRPMEEWDYSDGWVVKGDVRKCFESTDQEKLKAAVYPRLGDERYCYLLGKYIEQLDKGLALGHQTSHICVVFYLSKVLHFINQDLGHPDSGMYMDDWYAIAETKEEAVALLAAARVKFAELGYELNEKTVIFPLRHGIDFCGFHVYLTRTGKTVRKLHKSSKKRMKRRIKKWERDYAAGLISKEKIEQSFQSWCAHAKHGDTHQLIREMRKRLDRVYQQPVKENGNEQKDQRSFSRQPRQAQREWGCQKVHHARL